ncbi:MAG: hypothetical protein EOP04_11040 [Proteobacteria bacterium]|nr:MAG: hypothetical protein EOP04_11040 [Pseudomonadota bacterium]
MMDIAIVRSELAETSSSKTDEDFLMASWHRRRGSICVTVYYYGRILKKPLPVPRAQTDHLDVLPEAEIDAWVERWAEDNGHKVHRALKHSLSQTDELQVLWSDFQTYIQKMRNLEDKTMKSRENEFRGYILPYFVGIHGEKDVRNWVKHVGGFSLYVLTESGLKNMIDVKKKIWLVRRFGEYLVTSRVLTSPWVLMMPSSKVKSETTLKQRITPDEVLKEARILLAKSEVPSENKAITSSGKVVGRRKTLFNNDMQMALALLIGYFASLGPGEVYGLYKEDLITGQAALKTAESTYPTFEKFSLGSKLTLSKERQLGDQNIEKYPKNDYRFGAAHIWNVEAARIISQLVKEMEPGRLFRLSRGRLDKLHVKLIKSTLNVSAHDLRRASALYLGRSVKIPLEALQLHLRHAEIETTVLYIREPSTAEQKNLAEQDFDDVG